MFDQIYPESEIDLDDDPKIKSLLTIPLRVMMHCTCKKCKNKWETLFGQFALVLDAKRLEKYGSGNYTLNFKVVSYAFKCKNCPDLLLEDCRIEVYEDQMRRAANRAAREILQRLRFTFDLPQVNRGKNEEQLEKPHKADLCEACHWGICWQAKKN